MDKNGTHIPRPGILPPTLNGNFDAVNVVPVSVEISICPLLSHEFVYIPVA